MGITLESRRKMGERAKARFANPVLKERMLSGLKIYRATIGVWNKGKKGCINSGNFKRGHTVPDNWRKMSSIRRTGQKQSESWIKLMKKINIGNKHSLGMKHTKEWGINHSRMMKQKYKDDPTLVKRILARRNKSSLEIKMENIINKAKLPYKFVGNGKFVIGGKVPDFINTNGQKIAVEVFCTRHKNFCRGGIEQWKESRMKIFKEYGWELLFFNEKEVNTQTVVNKIGGDMY